MGGYRSPRGPILSFWHFTRSEIAKWKKRCSLHKIKNATGLNVDRKQECWFCRRRRKKKKDHSSFYHSEKPHPHRGALASCSASPVILADKRQNRDPCRNQGEEMDGGKREGGREAEHTRHERAGAQRALKGTHVMLQHLILGLDEWCGPRRSSDWVPSPTAKRLTQLPAFKWLNFSHTPKYWRWKEDGCPDFTAEKSQGPAEQPLSYCHWSHTILWITSELKNTTSQNRGFDLI